MNPLCWNLDDLPLSVLCSAKTGLTIGLFLILWGWEAWEPFFARGQGRLRHAGRNLLIALLNTLILAVAFGSLTVLLAEWAKEKQVGLLHAVELAWPLKLVVALVLLDGWLYIWHRLNHSVPFLWRFHRMHHSDTAMDVTTALRFHLGELAMGATLRLGLIPLLGVEFWQVLVHEALVHAVTFFHHANISLGKWDRVLRWVIVTPDFHKLHHSRWQPETDSNFATVLSVWDRVAGTFRMRANPGSIRFGLDEFDEPRWQTVAGMLRTPLANPGREDESRELLEEPREQRHELVGQP